MERHPLEEKLNASAADIMSAIERGFRCQADVKGKLAELFLCRKFHALKDAGAVEDVTWQDRDGERDFIVRYRGRPVVIECKNLRSPKARKTGALLATGAGRVELQKTRNSKDGTPTRGYKVDEFDVLAVSLFNETGQWDYLFTATKHLARRPGMEDFLVIMQPVPLTATGAWVSDPLRAFDDALGQ